jgi:cephalosporin hydroxylase
LSGVSRGEFPPPIDIDLDAPVRDYWRQRLVQHNVDSYFGIVMSKFPEDLRVYEHLLWSTRAEVVVEVGTDQGGSALWFRDRLRTLADTGLIDDFRVVSVDVDQTGATQNLRAVDPRFEDHVVLVEADICDADVRRRVDDLVPAGTSVLVVEDSAHLGQTTTAALRHLSHLVQPGGFFVVEDGVVDVEALRVYDGWPRGVAAAVDGWLTTAEGSCFTQRLDLQCYGLTCHLGGFLERVRPMPGH